MPEDRVGLFVRRSQEGAGTTAVQTVTAVWNFTSNNLVKSDKVLLQGFGLEMCYVAEGTFKVGDGMSDQGQFCEGGGGSAPFAITNAGPIAISNLVGCLWGASQSGGSTIGPAGTLSAAFPNGYSAFYSMKYAITQGQYADFLNTLTRVQQANRCVATTLGYYMSAKDGGSPTAQTRNTIQLAADDGVAPRVYTNASPDRACNFLSWADVAAFAAWSGLRPMTELEYEKACRGPLEPVAGEYAWGNANSTVIKTLRETDGTGNEYYVEGNANWKSNGGPGGPVRVGIFARPGATSREAAGAGYWGAMELSGNLWERPVTVGNTTGRAYTGLHGCGRLEPSGEASVVGWPESSGTGAGLRGGCWYHPDSNARAAARSHAASLSTLSDGSLYGGRAARSAP